MSEQARGNTAEALTLLRAGADLADKVGKHPVTPGTVLPQRELLADLLLELGRPREALAEYEASLMVAPNRLNALAGAARAADLAGEAARARTFANLVSALASPASTRPRSLPRVHSSRDRAVGAGRVARGGRALEID